MLEIKGKTQYWQRNMIVKGLRDNKSLYTSFETTKFAPVFMFFTTSSEKRLEPPHNKDDTIFYLQMEQA